MPSRSQQNYRQFSDLLRPLKTAQVLVVGGRVWGEGMDALREPHLHLVQTDIAPGPQTEVVCDAHELPFAGGSFDAVIIQAVLEHVFDPYHCVEEIYRVLKPGGLVYAETPFMQQVHMAARDFTRFSYLGHRRLFRQFEEIAAGPVLGPGTALAWSYRYFLRSFATGKMSTALDRLARWTSFFLPYFDGILLDKPGAYDAASAFYFLGRKSGGSLSDNELLKLYRGLG